MNPSIQQWERDQAYKHQLDRLTPEQKISLNAKENNCNRKMTPWEIIQIFNLGPSEEKRVAKQRLSDEVDQQYWADQ